MTPASAPGRATGRPVASAYASSTSSIGPSRRSRPWSTQITRSHIDRIVDIEWLTSSTVPACARISSTRSRLRALNSASPVARASSISRMSGRDAEEIANRSREPMPEE